MAEGTRYRMPLKRRREEKTDYRQRLKLLKSGKIRAVVRPSNKHIRVQFVRYNRDGDKIVASASSQQIVDMGWEGHGSNLSSSYLVGYLAGKRAIEKGIQEAILDIGLNYPEEGGKLFSTLNGIIDAGVSVPHDPEVLPDENRIKGEHIDDEMSEKFEEIKSRLEEL